MSDIERLLRGSIDIHIHPGPDVISRTVDVIEAARQAQQAGMRAIVLKNHYYTTAPLATLAGKLVPGIEVFGGLCLNSEIGGLNTFALKTSVTLGAKIVWMPTFSAVGSERKPAGGGISILDKDGKLLPGVASILELVKQNDLVLATGHIPPVEAIALIEEAARKGISKLAITHPLPLINFRAFNRPFELDDLRKLTQIGAFIDVTFLSLMKAELKNSIGSVLEPIRAIGIDHIIMSTDLGQVDKPLPVEGMRMCISKLLQNGFSDEEIELMIKVNPAKLLGLK